MIGLPVQEIAKYLSIVEYIHLCDKVDAFAPGEQFNVIRIKKFDIDKFTAVVLLKSKSIKQINVP